VEVLDRATCVELLRKVAIGRVAWATVSGDAVVVPVNFVVVDNSVVFRTAEGHKLDAVLEGRRICFEADDVEPALQAGWSVLVQGHPEVVSDPDELRRLELLPLSRIRRPSPSSSGSGLMRSLAVALRSEPVE
jgi:uncharacterized protein